MTTFVDTNILIYLLDPDSVFHAWAAQTVKEYQAKEGPLVICDVVFAELSVGLDDVKTTQAAIKRFQMERYAFSDDVLFRAGKAYEHHRKNGGKRSNVLSDFFIGAQAELEDAPLLTNDVKEYKSYFPNVKIVSPPTVSI